MLIIRAFIALLQSSYSHIHWCRWHRARAPPNCARVRSLPPIKHAICTLVFLARSARNPHLPACLPLVGEINTCVVPSVTQKQSNCQHVATLIVQMHTTRRLAIAATHCGLARPQSSPLDFGASAMLFHFNLTPHCTGALWRRPRASRAEGVEKDASRR